MRPLRTIMTILAIYVASIAVTGLVAPAARSEFMAQVFAQAPIAALLHLAGGAVALLAGAFQVNRGFRQRHRRLHRRLGMAYLVGVVAAGAAAIPLAVLSDGGDVARAGFAACAVAWLVTTLLGYHAIWRLNIPAHERWMTRSYAVTLAAVMLRIYMPVSMVAGVPFEVAYPAVAWLCWVPNLLLVEGRNRRQQWASGLGNRSGLVG